MTAQALLQSDLDAPALAPASLRRRVEAPTISVTDTYWGYVVTEATDRFDRETVLEAAGRFLGLILVLSAYAQWLLPAGLFGADALMAKIFLSGTLAMTGALVYWYAGRGLATDIHVDLVRRQLRVASRNARGQSRIEERVPMAAVESAFLKRSKEPGAEAQLMLRLVGGAELLHVATGREAELASLHRRLAHDLRPPLERLEDRLSRQIVFSSGRLSRR